MTIQFEIMADEKPAICKVEVPLNGDDSNVKVYAEANPDMVDLNVHQWCSAHGIEDLDQCNILRNYFLNLCFPDYLKMKSGPIYPIVFNDEIFNIQMKVTDIHINESIDRFCGLHTPPFEPSSSECMWIKSLFARDESFYSVDASANLLHDLYQSALTQPSDMKDHVQDHAKLAKDCEIVMEIGVRGMVSTWGALWGLTQNGNTIRKYIGVDLNFPSGKTWRKFEKVCQQSQIDCNFLQLNDMTLVASEIGPVDMLFIDALHTYAHVMYELTTFHGIVRKYIVLHDTSHPWGEDDEPYSGDYSEYPHWIDRSKRGVYSAVLDFLENHSTEWEIRMKKENNHGYTLLERRMNVELL